MDTLFRRTVRFVGRRVQSARRFGLKLSALGSGRFCPLCGGEFRRFLPFGRPRRAEALCPQCGSLERHRFLWRLFEREGFLVDGRHKAILHFAPEACLERHFRSIPGVEYTTTDREPGRAEIEADITSLPFPGDTFDLILCSHVLEHVADDRQALRELARVLRVDGTAILLVPQRLGPTDEDLSITGPQERLARFGQEDHVRCYGDDFVERVRGAGLQVRSVAVSDLLSANDSTRLGVPATCDAIHLAERGRGGSTVP